MEKKGRRKRRKEKNKNRRRRRRRRRRGSSEIVVSNKPDRGSDISLRGPGVVCNQSVPFFLVSSLFHDNSSLSVSFSLSFSLPSSPLRSP